MLVTYRIQHLQVMLLVLLHVMCCVRLLWDTEIVAGLEDVPQVLHRVSIRRDPCIGCACRFCRLRCIRRPRVLRDISAPASHEKSTRMEGCKLCLSPMDVAYYVP